MSELERFEDAKWWTLKVKERAWAEECRWTLKTGKGEVSDSLLLPPEKMQLSQLLNFGKVRPCQASDFQKHNGISVGSTLPLNKAYGDFL